MSDNPEEKDPVQEPAQEPAPVVEPPQSDPIQEPESEVPSPDNASAPQPDTPVSEADVPSPLYDHAADEVERWWNDHFPGSILGRNIEIWNLVQSAKENLKARLRALLRPLP